MFVARLQRLADGGGQVALVDHRVAERGDLLAEPGDAKRRRPHVDAASAGAEVERHANQVHWTHYLLNFSETDIPSPDGDTIVVITASLS